MDRNRLADSIALMTRLAIVRGFLFVAACVTCRAATAETWYFKEVADRSNSNYWNKAEMWVSAEGGTNGLPRTGDALVITNAPASMHRANHTVTMRRIHFGPKAGQSIAHQGLYLMASDDPDDGLIYEPTGEIGFWCGLYVLGDVKVNFSASNYARSFDEGIQGFSSSKSDRAILVGPARVISSKNFTNLEGLVVRQGAVRANGTQAVQQGFEVYFDGTTGTAWYELGNISQDFVNGHVHSATNALPTTGHGLTDLSGNRTLTLSGASPVDEQYFEGVLAGTLSFCWNQTDAAKVFRFVRGQSPTTGALTAQSGVVRIGGGASFEKLSKIAVGAAGRVEIASDAGLVNARQLEVTTGGKIVIPAGVVLTNKAARVDGVRLDDRSYTSADCAWIEGDGTVLVDRYANTYGANQLVLDIAEGETLGITQAIADYNAAHGTSYAVDDLNGQLKDYTLVKRGLGTLSMDVTNKTYQGIVHVESGVIDLKAQYGLGRSEYDASAFYVHDGATISIEKITTNASRIGNRIVHVAGTGFEGRGALVATGNHVTYGTVNMLGKEIDLEDDAKIVLREWYAAASTLRLNGFTCTFKGSTVNGNAILCSTVADNGRIVLIDSQFRSSPVTFNGTDPDNTITFGNNGGYRFWGGSVKGDGARTWTYVFNGANTYLFGDTGALRDSGNTAFYNRFFITNTVNQTSQGNTEYSSIYLHGKVSGTGRFALVTGNSEAHYLHLMNAANDFSGGVSVGRGVVCSYGGQSLPDSGTVKLNDTLDLSKTGEMSARPEFYGLSLFGTDSCSLPPLEYDGTKSVMRVQGGRGSWKSVVKKGTGTFAYNSEAGSPLLDVRGGTFKLPRGAAPGLWEGVTNCADAAAAATALAGTATPTNMIVRGVTSALLNPYQAPTTPTGTKLITYSGYVWNRAAEDKTMTFASSVTGAAVVKIDGETVLDAAANERKSANVTLTPGPHAFEYRAVNGTPTDASSAWPRRFGFVYDAQGRNDLAVTNNFTAGVDAGDGSLFTRSVSTDDLPAFEKIALSAGAKLDLNGNAYTAADIAGAGTVTNTATDASAAPKLILADRITVNAGADETLRIAVPLELGTGFKVSVTNTAHRLRKAHTVFTSAAPFTGKTTDIPVVADGNDGWVCRVTPDGKSLEVVRAGLMIFLR